MKKSVNYQIDQISLTWFFLYVAAGFVVSFSLTILCSLYIFSIVLPAIVLILSAGLFWFFWKRALITSIKISIESDDLILNEHTRFRMNELVSYNVGSDRRFEWITLRFAHKTIRLNSLLGSKTNKEFHKLKTQLLKKIQSINDSQKIKIEKKNFYTSRLARPYAYSTIAFIVVMLGVCLFVPGYFKLSTLLFILLFTVALIPIWLRIFSQTRVRNHTS